MKNNMPEFKPELKQNTPEDKPELIDSPDKFRYLFQDAKNQFQAIMMDRVSPKNFTIEQLMEINKSLNQETPYLSFEDYIKRERNQIISEITRRNFSLMITVYNNLIEKLKSPKNTKEFEETLENINIFVRGKF